MSASKVSPASVFHDTRGLTTVEYVIVLAMIAVLAVGLWKSFGQNISQYLSKSRDSIDNAMPTKVGGKG